MFRMLSFGSQNTATSKLDTQEETPTFPLINAISIDSHAADSRWYDHWVKDQIRDQPKTLFSTISTEVAAEKQSSASLEDPCSHVFLTIWQAVRNQLGIDESPSLGELVQSLENKGLLRPRLDEADTSVSCNLVFAILGWQTMLFRPDFGSCPGSQITIVDETDGYRTHAHSSLKQDLSSREWPLNTFLEGFGQVLPSKANPPEVSEDDKAAMNHMKSISPASFNARMLCKLAGTVIRWTDSLACHMEYNRSADILWLFRHPGFCGIQLRGRSLGSGGWSALYACALTKDAAAEDYWTSHDEVDEYMKEVLLSYRLLFGQDKASRRFFKTLQPFEDIPALAIDPHLDQLCSSKDWSTDLGIKEREVYELEADFPLMREKLVTLQRQLSIRRPKSWRDLWNDRRDSSSWFTFWVVLIIGGLGLLLAFVQIILQLVQVVMQARSTN